MTDAYRTANDQYPDEPGPPKPKDTRWLKWWHVAGFSWLTWVVCLELLWAQYVGHIRLGEFVTGNLRVMAFTWWGVSAFLTAYAGIEKKWGFVRKAPK